MPKTTLDWMRNKVVSGVRRGRTGEGDWVFEFEAGSQLRASTLWRIVRAGRVHLTSQDEGQQFGLPAPINAAAEALQVLVSTPISEVVVDDEIGDLVIEFGQDLSLEVLNNSAGCEAWELVGPNGALVVASGGNGAAIWNPAV